MAVDGGQDGGNSDLRCASITNAMLIPDFDSSELSATNKDYCVAAMTPRDVRAIHSRYGADWCDATQSTAGSIRGAQF